MTLSLHWSAQMRHLQVNMKVGESKVLYRDYRVGQKSQYTDIIKYLLIKCMKLLEQSKKLYEMKTKRTFKDQLYSISNSVSIIKRIGMSPIRVIAKLDSSPSSEGHLLQCDRRNAAHCWLSISSLPLFL